MPTENPQLFFGTCSWKYDSWKGIVYERAKEYTANDYLSDYAKHYKTVGTYCRFGQLTKAGNAETFHQVIFNDTATKTGGNTHNQINTFFGGKVAPAFDDVTIVSLRGGKLVGVINTIVIEEHARHFVTFFKRGFYKLVSRVGSLMRKRPFVD